MTIYHAFFLKEKIAELGIDLTKDIWGPYEVTNLARKLGNDSVYLFSEAEKDRGNPKYEKLTKDPEYAMKVVSGN